MEKIEPIKLCCGGLTRTLPLAFDESMSYVELLYAMNNKLTEAINDLNQIIDDYSNIEANFDEIYNRLNELNNDTSLNDNPLAYITKEEHSVDIDNISDIERVKRYLNNNE